RGNQCIAGENVWYQSLPCPHLAPSNHTYITRHNCSAMRTATACRTTKGREGSGEVRAAGTIRCRGPLLRRQFRPLQKEKHEKQARHEDVSPGRGRPAVDLVSGRKR